jgi:hypothetical protein
MFPWQRKQTKLDRTVIVLGVFMRTNQRFGQATYKRTLQGMQGNHQWLARPAALNLGGMDAL